MNTSQKLASILTIVSLLIFLVQPDVQAQWNKTTAGTYDYNAATNWNSGYSNGVFSTTLTGSQTITFGQDTTLNPTNDNSLYFSYSGAHNLTFQSDSTTSRTLTLNGNIRVTSANLRTITIGTDANPLTLDLGTGNIRLVTADYNATIALGALITGSGSALNVGGGINYGTVRFLNTNNSFSGNFETAGHVEFSHLADGGQNSSLGAGSSITLSATNAWLTYIGTNRNSSDRTVHLASSNNRIAAAAAGGKIVLTGQVVATNGADRTLELVQANGGSVEISGQILNQTDGTKLSIMKSGVGTATFSGLDNDFRGAITNGTDIIAFRSIANLGQKSSLGAPTNATDGIIHMASSSSTVLNYIGEGNSTSDRQISLESTINAGAWLTVVNSGSMVITGDILTGQSTKAQFLNLSGTSLVGTGTLAGAIGDSPGNLATTIVKTGKGTWALTGNSSFTGGVDVGNGGGILQFTSVANTGTNSALGASGSLRLGGGGSTLQYIGSSNSVTDRQVILNSSSAGSAAFLDASGTGSVKFQDVTSTNATAKLLILHGTSTTENTISGAISAALGFIELRKYGVGTWVLAGANTFTNGTKVYGGTLRLDFSQVGSPANDIIISTNALVLRGGTLEIKGDNSGTSSQTFQSTALQMGSYNQIRVDSNGGSGTTLDLKAITRNAGVTVDFTLPANGSILTTSTNVNGVLASGGAAYATVNKTNWATVSGGAITALATHQTDTNSATWVSSDNLWLSGNATVSSDKTINTVKLDNGASISVAADKILTIGASGLLINEAGGTINGGILRGSSAATRDLVVIQNDTSSSFEISSIITNHGGLSYVTKSGDGILKLSGLNAYSGATMISRGVLEVNVLANGGVVSGIGAAATNSGYLVFNGGTLRYTGVETSTDRSFNIASVGTIEASGTGALTWNGSALWDATDNYISDTFVLTLAGTNTGNNTFAGKIANPSGGQYAVIKSGAGKWILSNSNTYTGVTDIRQGTLAVNGTLSSAGLVEIQNGASLGGSGTVGTVKVHSGGTITPGNSIGVLSAGNTTLEGGSYYAFELDNDGSGSAGINWDQFAVDGSLVLQELSTTNQFTINLFTLNNSGNPGSLAIWDPNVDHTWASIFTTTNGFYGTFDPDTFAINTSGFLSGLNGSFSVVQNGLALDLQYTAIPEPGTWALLLTGGLIVWGLRRRHPEA